MCLFFQFLITATQKIVGRKHGKDLSPEDYVAGALYLYATMIIIFIIALKFAAKFRRG